MAAETNYKGDVSEWNEGNFKSMRLHQAQLLINNARTDPLKRISNGSLGSKWGYELWFVGIETMFFEGAQKYSSSEYNAVTLLKREIEQYIKDNPIGAIKKTIKGPSVFINIGGWEGLKIKLEAFEYMVRHLNDKHGFSTRSVGTKGLF